MRSQVARDKQTLPSASVPVMGHSSRAMRKTAAVTATA